MKLTGTCNAVAQFEGICDELVKQKMARLDKCKKDVDSKSYVNVYEVFVGEDGWSVQVRFWYNNITDHASVSISSEGIELLLQATTVIGLMNRLGKVVKSNGNGVDLNELEGLLRKALVVMTGEEKNIQLDTGDTDEE